MNTNSNLPLFRSRPLKFSPALRGLVMVALLFGLLVPTTWGSTSSLPAPAAPADLPTSIFGVEMHPFDASGGLNLVTQTHTAWVRGITIDWSQVESVQGTYDWFALGEAALEVANAQANGWTPVILVHGAPTWAQAAGGAECGPIAVSYYDDFANFIASVIADASSPLQPLGVIYWAIWNEPDTALEDLPSNDLLRGCWGDKTDEYYGGRAYGDLLRVVYPRLKLANPQAQLIAGELLLDCDPAQVANCDSSKFLEGILVSGGEFDGLSFHAYDFYQGSLGEFGNANWASAWDSTGPSLLAKAAYVRQLLDQYGYTDKYLLNTENALLCDTCTDDLNFEITKSWYLMEAYTSALADGLAANIWFEVTGAWGRNNGLVTTPDLTPLDAYTAYQVAGDKLGGAVLQEVHTEYPGVTAYEFRDAGCTGTNDCHVWALWSTDGDSHTIQLPVLPLRVQTAVGSDRTPTVEFNIGPAPRYLEMPAELPRLRLPVMPQDYFISLIPLNGDFEDGLVNWIQYEPVIPVTTVASHPTNPLTSTPDLAIPAGTTSVLLGNPQYPCTAVPYGPNENASVSQSITVPHKPNVWLTFKYIIYSQDASVASIYDRFEVYVDNTLLFTDGNQVNQGLSCLQWWRVPSPQNPGPGGETSGWATGIIDLGPYRGETVNISFRNYSRFDANYNTYTYLDDIAVETSD